VRLEAGAAAGATLEDLRSRDGGCAILAIERDGELVTKASNLQVKDSDAVWLCGTAEAIRSFSAQFTR
jgi:Trk K+ transport system NAD-binding subunit